VSAVATHFLCGTVPIIVAIVCTILLSQRAMSSEAAELAVKATTIVSVAETIINVCVYVTRLPGVRSSIFGTSSVHTLTTSIK
jgi:hypothetical protein